jgi:CheY-like chemotaxis protein
MLAGKSILIADDDRQLVYVLSLRCRELGLKVREAYDSVSRWQKYTPNGPTWFAWTSTFPEETG